VIARTGCEAAGMSHTLIGLDEIRAAADALPRQVRRTPLLPLAEELPGGGSLFAKCENLQQTGSYKLRAAFTVLTRLSPDEQARGAALSSSGNFAAAFAWAGRTLGIPTTVVMMQKTQPYKIERTRQMGARVVLCENRFEARFETLERLAATEGLVAIDHLEDRAVLCGHGTVGLEILEDLPEVEVVLVPVSTGGLLAGVAAAIKALRPQVEVIGVQPEGNDSTWRSVRAGHPVSIPEVQTLCDALTSTRPGHLPFAHIQALVSGIELVGETEIVQAVRWLADSAKLVVEPGGAVGVAHLQPWALAPRFAGRRVCVLLSGGNLAPERLAGFLTCPPESLPT